MRSDGQVRRGQDAAPLAPPRQVFVDQNPADVGIALGQSRDPMPPLVNLDQHVLDEILGQARITRQRDRPRPPSPDAA